MAGDGAAGEVGEGVGAFAPDVVEEERGAVGAEFGVADLPIVLAGVDADGGALRLSLEGGDVDVAPRTGSVVFLSELEHEVLPAMRERWSIAAWLRRRQG